MTIRHLQIFISVCEEMNMSSAAKKLYMTQPAVSQAIKELEEHYNSRLFERFPNSLYITKDGKSLFHLAKQIISLLQETETSIRDSEKTSVLKIGANITVGDTMIYHIMSVFQEKYPNQKFSIYINNGKNIREKLSSNELDLALMEEGKNEDFLKIDNFYEDRVVFVANDQHRLRKNDCIMANDLSGEDFLIREKGAGVRDIFDSIMAVKGISTNIKWESCSSQALIQAAQQGFGIAVLPYRLVKEYLREEKLWELEIQDINLNRKLQIVLHKNKWVSKEARDFIEIVKNLNFMEENI